MKTPGIKKYRDVAHKIAAQNLTPEAILKSQVVALLVRMPGVDVLRMNVGVANHGGRKVRYLYPGVADLMVRVRKNKCGPWRTVWIELKAKDGRQSEAQIAFQQQIEIWGDTYVVVRSVEDALMAVGATDDSA